LVLGPAAAQATLDVVKRRYEGALGVAGGLERQGVAGISTRFVERTVSPAGSGSAVSRKLPSRGCPMMLANRSLVLTSAATRVSAGQYDGTPSAPAAGICAIIMAQMPASRTARNACDIRATRSLLAGGGGEIVEMHVAIGLGP
jgi:hypothetical protein